MEDVLAIFPSRGLDNSILIPIYIGLLIHAFFTESLGWSFAGLVVSGYLASVFVIAPQAGLVICMEIVTTYVVVYTLSELLSRFGWWHSLFGRDRFLAFFIISLLVRLFYEAWFFQSLSDWTVQLFGLPLEAVSHLYGIGLVIVPLTAHAMWKPGFVRGAIQVGTPVVLTYLILVYLLIPNTNFSIANFELTFQDLALDFASSPKIYITLIVGMMLAARFNLKLGWDFNGIMIPALLAVAWYMPIKVAATLVEASLVAGIAWMIASLPIFMRSNLEGSRRLILIFTVGLGLKFMLGYYFTETAPGFRVSDLFGFGYLLPSLVALNIWERRSWSLVIGPTLLTSFLAFIFGNIVGLALFQVDKLFVAEGVAESSVAHAESQLLDADPLQLHLASVQTFAVLPEDFRPTSAAARLRYQRVLAGVRNLVLNKNIVRGNQFLDESFTEDLKRLHLEVVRTQLPDDPETTLIVLREPLDSPLHQLQGWGTVVFVPGCKDGVLLEVPYPYEEAAALDAALAIFPSVHACGLLVNGWRSFRPRERSVLHAVGSPFSVAHELLAKQAVVQIRTSPGPTVAYVQQRVPEAMPLTELKNRFPTYSIRFDPYEKKNPARNRADIEFMELVLNEQELLNLWPTSEPSEQEQSQSGLATLRELLDSDEEAIAPPYSEAYRTPMPIEMTYLENAIIRPLRRELLNYKRSETDMRLSLTLIKQRASVLGYELSLFRSEGRKGFEVLLHEAHGERHWGAYLFRAGSSRWTIEVPRPLLETGVAEMAMDLYGRLNASALYVATADLQARRDGLADITRLENVVNPFHAAHRAAYPVKPGATTPWVLIVRGISKVRPIDEDVLISAAMDLPERSPRSMMMNDLLHDLDLEGLKWQLYAGDKYQLGLKGVDDLQLRYSASLDPQSAAVLWVNAEVRMQQPGGEQIARWVATIRDLGYPLVSSSMEDVLKIPAEQPASATLKETLELANEFSRLRNVSLLKAISEKAGKGDVLPSLLRDSCSGKYFLLLVQDNQGPRCVVRMESPAASDAEINTTGELELNTLRYGQGAGVCNGEVLP